MAEIVVQHHIDASPETVYRYLTEADKWAQWQGESATIEAREGGIFSIVMANGMNARGQFTNLVPNESVAFTWGWVDRPGIPPGSTLVTIDLLSAGRGTLVVLTHSELPDAEVSAHRDGWVRHLPRLAQVVSE